MKLEKKERRDGRQRRVYGEVQTPLERVLASEEVSQETKKKLQTEKAKLNPFVLNLEVERRLKEINALRRSRD